MNDQMNRRQLLKVTGAAAAATATGATFAPRSLARQDAKVTITWWDYFSDANGAAMDAQHARYMKANPNVTIERTYIAFADLKQRLLQGAAAGDLPDVVIIDNPDHQAFSSLGIFEDVTDRVAEWGQADKYFEGPWFSTTFKDKNYGIPDNSNCLVLWYNTSFLKEAGLEPPTTWEELTSSAQALTEGDRFGLAVSGIKSEEGTFQWLPFLWATGEDLATLDSDGGRRALQLWVDMVDNGSMSKGILGWDQQDVRTQFQNGRAAMMSNGPWQIPVLKKEAPDLEWNVVTLPKDKQGASILGGENAAIVKGSKNVDAAWALLTWRQEPEELRTYLTDAGKLPSRADLAEGFSDDPVITVFLEQLKVAKARAYGDKYPEISAAIQEAIQSAVGGQTDVESALKKAQQTITPLLPQG
jgi:multiple sugar transport system substrate-binding protein